MPCYKLGIRFGRPEIVKRFLQSGRSGFYLGVLEEGRISAGDSVELLTRDEHGVTVADIVSLYKADVSYEPRPFAQGERVTCIALILARLFSQTPLGSG